MFKIWWFLLCLASVSVQVTLTLPYKQDDSNNTPRATSLQNLYNRLKDLKNLDDINSLQKKKIVDIIKEKFVKPDKDAAPTEERKPLQQILQSLTGSELVTFFGKLMCDNIPQITTYFLAHLPQDESLTSEGMETTSTNGFTSGLNNEKSPRMFGKQTKYGKVFQFVKIMCPVIQHNMSKTDVEKTSNPFANFKEIISQITKPFMSPIVQDQNQIDQDQNQQRSEKTSYNEEEITETQGTSNCDVSSDLEDQTPFNKIFRHIEDFISNTENSKPFDLLQKSFGQILQYFMKNSDISEPYITKIQTPFAKILQYFKSKLSHDKQETVFDKIFHLIKYFMPRNLNESKTSNTETVFDQICQFTKHFISKLVKSETSDTETQTIFEKIYQFIKHIISDSDKLGSLNLEKLKTIIKIYNYFKNFTPNSNESNLDKIDPLVKIIKYLNNFNSLTQQNLARNSELDNSEHGENNTETLTATDNVDFSDFSDQSLHDNLYEPVSDFSALAQHEIITPTKLDQSQLPDAEASDEEIEKGHTYLTQNPSTSYEIYYNNNQGQTSIQKSPSNTYENGEIIQSAQNGDTLMNPNPKISISNSFPIIYKQEFPKVLKTEMYAKQPAQREGEPIINQNLITINSNRLPQNENQVSEFSDIFKADFYDNELAQNEGKIHRRPVNPFPNEFPWNESQESEVSDILKANLYDDELAQNKIKIDLSSINSVPYDFMWNENQAPDVSGTSKANSYEMKLAQSEGETIINQNPIKSSSDKFPQNDGRTWELSDILNSDFYDDELVQNEGKTIINRNPIYSFLNKFSQDESQTSEFSDNLKAELYDNEFVKNYEETTMNQNPITSFSNEFALNESQTSEYSNNLKAHFYDNQLTQNEGEGVINNSPINSISKKIPQNLSQPNLNEAEYSQNEDNQLLKTRKNKNSLNSQIFNPSQKTPQLPTIERNPFEKLHQIHIAGISRHK